MRTEELASGGATPADEAAAPALRLTLPAAASDVDTRTWYLSEGRSVRVAQERARATVVAYLAGSAGDSGVRGVRLRSVQVLPGEGGPEVTVEVAAPARVGLLRLLRLVPPEMEGRAAATARLVPP